MEVNECFTPWQLYPWGKTHWTGVWVGPQSQSGCGIKKKKTRESNLGHLACSHHCTVLTEVSWLSSMSVPK
jgi:hypothetical protein